MSIFKRKKKPQEEASPDLTETRAYDLNDLESLPKTDPGYRSATATIRHALDTLDRQIEEKRAVQKTARKITQSVRDMDLKWSLKTPKKAT